MSYGGPAGLVSPVLAVVPTIALLMKQSMGSFTLYGSLLTFLFSFFFFETRSHSVALTGLDGTHYVD